MSYVRISVIVSIDSRQAAGTFWATVFPQLTQNRAPWYSLRMPMRASLVPQQVHELTCTMLPTQICAFCALKNTTINNDTRTQLAGLVKCA